MLGAGPPPSLMSRLCNSAPLRSELATARASSQASCCRTQVRICKDDIIPSSTVHMICCLPMLSRCRCWWRPSLDCTRPSVSITISTNWRARRPWCHLIRNKLLDGSTIIMVSPCPIIPAVSPYCPSLIVVSVVRERCTRWVVTRCDEM